MANRLYFIALSGFLIWIFDEIKHCAFQKIAFDVFDSPRFIDVKNNFSKSDVIDYFKDYYENL